MSQLSLFDDDHYPLAVEDMGGLLLSSAQIQPRYGHEVVRGRRRQAPEPDTARLTLLCKEEWRMEAVCSHILTVPLDIQVSEVSALSDGRQCYTLRVEDPLLIPLERRWRKGAVKALPEGWVPSAQALRLWAFYSVRFTARCCYLPIDDVLYDSNRTAALEPLVAGLEQEGLGGTFLTRSEVGPAFRLSGMRKMERLRTLMGLHTSALP